MFWGHESQADGTLARRQDPQTRHKQRPLVIEGGATGSLVGATELSG